MRKNSIPRSYSSGSRSDSSDSGSQRQKPSNQQFQAQNQLVQTKTYKESILTNLIQMSEALQQEQPVAEQQVEVVEQQNIDIDAKVEENLQQIHLNIFARQKRIKLQDEPFILPVVLQIQTIKSQQAKAKSNIDLICVVDVSGSMSGDKIKLVKDSLRYVQKILSPEDRIALVTFGTQAGINLSWTRNSTDNKKKIKKSIVDMKIRDSTNIAAGVGLGLRMVKERQYRNPVTCMFVLSDGQDDDRGADLRCQEALLQYNIQDTVSIYTFGYGSDHDPKVMSNIANLKGGKFAFIDKIDRVSEHFILAMGGMLSVKAKNVKLVVESNNENYKIKKIFGDDYLWKKLNENQFEMNLNFLLNGEKKEFALELELPVDKQIEIEQANVLQVKLSGLLIELDKQFLKESNLMIDFTKENVEIQLNEIVEINYLRGKAGDYIGQAKELANKQQYDQAQQLLNRMIEEIEASPFNKAQPLTVVYADLFEVKEVCKPKVYKERGEALMLNKQRNHIQRQRSINNSEEWDSGEEEQMGKLRNGKIQLSCSDSGSDRDDSDVQILQKKQKRGRRSSSHGSNSANSKRSVS